MNDPVERARKAVTARLRDAIRRVKAADPALGEHLERAGLIDAREERVEATLRWRDRDEACAAIFDGGPGALPFSMFTDEIRQAVRDEFVASIEPYRRGSGFEVPAEFVYGTAQKPE